MPSASINQNIIRCDAVTKPNLNVSGLSGQGWLKFSDWFYIPVTNGDNEIQFPNRTELNGVMELRDVANVATDATKSGSLSLDGPDSLVRSGTGWAGAYLDDPLSVDAGVVIQRSLGAIDQISGLAFLDTEADVTHDYTSDLIPHAMLFGLNGTGEIREFGVPILGFNYLATDQVMMEIKNGLVYYFLLHDSGILETIHVSPAVFEGDALGEALAYSSNAVVDNFSIQQTTDNVTNESQYISTGIMMPSIIQGDVSTIGVLYGFQDWRNDFATASTADVLQMADNNVEFTFPNQKKRLRSISPNLATRDKAYRFAVEQFFDWHGIEKDFVFVDDAKKDVSGVHTYWWARFAAPLGQLTRQSCLTAFNTQIVETYNTTFIPPPA